jgi:hypothetical protein
VKILNLTVRKIGANSCTVRDFNSTMRKTFHHTSTFINDNYREMNDTGNPIRFKYKNLKRKYQNLKSSSRCIYSNTAESLKHYCISWDYPFNVCAAIVLNVGISKHIKITKVINISVTFLFSLHRYSCHKMLHFSHTTILTMWTAKKVNLNIEARAPLRCRLG